MFTPALNVPAHAPPSCLVIPGLGAAEAAAVFRASPHAIAMRSRVPRIARARQFAVYLHHVALGESLSACGRLFARDRATVRHACARIEDMRDDPLFDYATIRLETALMAQRDLALLLAAATDAEETTR